MPVRERGDLAANRRPAVFDEMGVIWLDYRQTAGVRKDPQRRILRSPEEGKRTGVPQEYSFAEWASAPLPFPDGLVHGSNRVGTQLRG